jgi:hypothetical protein
VYVPAAELDKLSRQDRLDRIIELSPVQIEQIITYLLTQVRVNCGLSDDVDRLSHDIRRLREQAAEWNPPAK